VAIGFFLAQKLKRQYNNDLATKERQMSFYRFVGFSRHPNGRVEVRYASELGRARVLERNGHTEVRLFDMGQPEHKMECIDQMLNIVEHTEHDLTFEQVDALRTEAEALGFRFKETA
jgi:hypothetical protein